MVEEFDMITSGLSCKDHTPFGRFAFDFHSFNKLKNNETKSLSEGVGNISIYDSRSQISETWCHRVTSVGNVEELYSREKTVVLSSTCGSASGASKIIKSYSVQSPIQQVFWCSFLLPSNEVDTNTGAVAEDEVQTGFCIVECNCVTVVLDNGQGHHVTLPFHIVNAWPLEKGLLFQRALQKCSNRDNANTNLPIWFSMLHPLADLSPVICRGSTHLSYVTSSSQHIAHVSADASPYLAVIYDCDTMLHSMYLVRRTTPKEEKTYTELHLAQSIDSSWQPKHMTTVSHHHHHHHHSSIALTPGATGFSAFLTLSSVLSPAATSMSPRVGDTLGTPSLRRHSLTHSPHLNKLNPTLSMNSPSLSSMHHLSSMQKTAAASPSISASVAHSSFTSTGSHHLLSQDLDMPADMLEPIRPDICLHHVWTDRTLSSKGKACRTFITRDQCGQSYLCLLIPTSVILRCIKLTMSHSATESVIFGNAINITAQDACPAPALNMVLVLDMECNIQLYSGPTHISMLYIPRLSFTGSARSLSTTPVRPSCSSIRASSRPGSAKSNSKANVQTIIFDTSQEEANWSPVHLELNDSTNLLVQGADDLPEKTVESLHSVTKRKLVLTLSNGQLCSTELPSFCTDSAVIVCLQALSAHLSAGVAMHVFPRWYLINQAAGAEASCELLRFLKYLTEICGLPSWSSSTMSQPSSPTQSKKRAKTMSQANNSHFDLLLSRNQCDIYRRDSSLLGIVFPEHLVTGSILDTSGLMIDEELAPRQKPVAEVKVKRSVQIAKECQSVDFHSPLANHIYTVFIILHLCYEEMKLNKAFINTNPTMAKTLLQLSTCLKLREYSLIYLKDFPRLSSIDLTHWRNITIHSKVKVPSWYPLRALSLPQLLIKLLESGKPGYTVYYLPNTTRRIESLIKLYTMYSTKCVDYAQLHTDFLQPLPVAGQSLSNHMQHEEKVHAAVSDCLCTEEMMLLYMCAQGMDELTLDSLPFACTPLLYEAIYRCQSVGRSSWPASALSLIRRQDLAALSNPSLIPSPGGAAGAGIVKAKEEETAKAINQQPLASSSKLKQQTGMEVLDYKVLKMRWGSDLRLEEVKRCLISSQPVKITIQQKPEVSDHQFIEQKQRHLLALCQRTMALPIGRGMLTLRSHKPVLTESVHIPILSLSGKSYPTQSSVELSGDAQGQTATRLSVWPAFHNGVAAGLCLNKEAEVDTAWILYNKPKVTERDEVNQISEHAGFLLALGMNGYLNNLARLSLHDYLIKGHEMTAVGILLGISASMRGTMDIDTVRLLTIHTPSLLPPSSTRLDIAHNTKIAALIGLGLVYYCSTHRHIAGVLLQEIDHSPDIICKGVTDDRESYSLAAGLALGMVMMGKGADMIGLHDLNIANRLSLLMTGGHRSTDMCKDTHGCTIRTASEQVYEGETINIDVTSAGATIALGLTYFNTKSNTVRDWLKIPHSQYLLESIRPDHLQLRTLAHALVVWDNVVPTSDWVSSYLPPIVAANAFCSEGCDSYDGTDNETHSQAYCYIISGACFALGLKFAGSCNKSAYDTLLDFVRKFVCIYQKPSLVEQSGRHVLENALCTCLLSLAMVMSGSGDLQVFRLCRYLRARIAVPLVTYGSHMAIHMALALLFLGSGRYTLSCKPHTLPLLICSFFPRFPVHSNDNRYHLQALRHLYVQAVEPRLVFPVDIDTGEACYVPLEVTLKPTHCYSRHTYIIYAPGMLPDVDTIEKVAICDTRYWPMQFTSENGLNCLRKVLSERGSLAVKRRSGHLPYSMDPGGVLGAMSRALLYSSASDDVTCDVIGGVIGQREIRPEIYFMGKSQIDERSFVYLATREAVSKDRKELLSVYQTLYQIVSGDDCCGIDLQQIYLLVMYMGLSSSCIINRELVELAVANVRDKNMAALSSPALVEHLDDLLLYCTQGKFPTKEEIYNHLALYSDIVEGSISSIADVNKPALLAKLHLNTRLSDQLLTAIHPS